MRVLYINGTKGTRAWLGEHVDPTEYENPNLVGTAVLLAPGLIMTPVSSVLEAANAGHRNPMPLYVATRHAVLRMLHEHGCNVQRRGCSRPRLSCTRSLSCSPRSLVCVCAHACAHVCVCISVCASDGSERGERGKNDAFPGDLTRPLGCCPPATAPLPRPRRHTRWMCGIMSRSVREIIFAIGQ